MSRVWPPELARLVAGPWASTSVTSRPDRARWYAVHAPKQPAPTTTMRRMRNLQTLDLEPRTQNPEPRRHRSAALRRAASPSDRRAVLAVRVLQRDLAVLEGEEIAAGH